MNSTLTVDPAMNSPVEQQGQRPATALDAPRICSADAHGREYMPETIRMHVAPDAMMTEGLWDLKPDEQTNDVEIAGLPGSLCMAIGQGIMVWGECQTNWHTAVRSIHDARANRLMHRYVNWKLDGRPFNTRAGKVGLDGAKQSMTQPVDRFGNWTRARKYSTRVRPPRRSHDSIEIRGGQN